MAVFHDTIIPTDLQQGVLEEFSADRLNFNPEAGAFGETRKFMTERARALYPDASHFSGGIYDFYALRDGDAYAEKLHCDYGEPTDIKVIATVADVPFVATLIFDPISAFKPGTEVAKLLRWTVNGLE